MLDEQLKEMQHQMNAYAIEYGNLFAKGLYTAGIIKDIKPEELQKYFANPDFYQDVIDGITQYFYIINAEVRITYDYIESLPKLNYRIENFEKDNNADKNKLLLNKLLHIIDHKRLTRDLLKQNTSYGGLIGIWLGDKNDLTPFVFNDFKYVEPRFRSTNGRWQCSLDLSWFDTMDSFERELILKQFDPYITESDYNDYKSTPDASRYKPLPIERTFVLGTGKLKRNQARGTAWTTPIMLDILHKRKLKDVEQTVANKIINAVAVLTMGSFDADDLKRDYHNLPQKLINDIHVNVKNALSNGSAEGISLVTIPNFSKLEFPDIDSDALEADKFKQINSDILSGIGLSGVALNGEGSNYQSAKLNLELFYTRLAVLLEEIESEVYGRLFNLILPVKQKNNYRMIYQKERPVELKDILNHIKGLNDKGWSNRHYIEELGFNYDSFFEQSMHEAEQLKIFERLKPPPTSFTQSSDNINSDNNGRPPVGDNDTESENTIRTRDSQGN